MALDEFVAGVNPGGMQSKNDIKLLICYILSSISCGISKADIFSILQENKFANYFEASDAFSDLLENNNICCSDESLGIYTVTSSGKLISTQLDALLPLSVREHALSAALRVQARAKREKENNVTIEKIECGYCVKCNISGGDIDLMSTTLYVPDMMQANMVKENFQKNPEILYSAILSILTNDKSLASEVLNNIN